MLIFAPLRTWEQIAKAKRGVAAIVFLFLLPLMLLCSLAEGFALTKWGEKRGIESHIVIIPQDLAIRFEVVQLLLGLAMVFLAAKILEWVAEGFHFYPRYAQSFTVIAYGYSPTFLARFMDCFPGVNTWLSWSLGVVASVYVLYHGVALVLQPDQTKGFGIYLMCILILTLLGGSMHLFALQILHQKIGM